LILPTSDKLLEIDVKKNDLSNPSLRVSHERSNLKLSVIGAAILAAMFGVLTVAVTRGATHGFDVRILYDIHTASSPALTEFFRIVTFTGSPGLVLVTLILVLIFLLRKRYALAAFLAIDLGGIFAVNTAVKFLVRRNRPEVFPWLTHAFGFSFPSGHTSASAAVYWFLAYLLFRGGRKLAGIPVVFWALLIGFSRMYLGVHYPTDVAGGLLLSGAWLIILVSVERSLPAAFGGHL
jgi:undecaprenyl-diphosphatase